MEQQGYYSELAELESIPDSTVQKVNIVGLDIPYLNLLVFCFKFVLAWIPAILLIYFIFFMIGLSCAGIVAN